MKFGVRKPSIKKSIKARTTGRAKRAVKKAVVPGYGKKGMGWVKNPKKAAYNKVYNKTTISAKDLVSTGSKKKSSSKHSGYNNGDYVKENAATYITLINEHSQFRRCKIGYSWTSLFFFYLVPLFRGDFKNFVKQFIVFTILHKISSTLFFIAVICNAGIYNTTYIKNLIAKGYRPCDEESESLLKEKEII